MDAAVLVTAAGSIVAQGIIKSLKLANKTDNRYDIVAADMSPLAAGLYRSDTGVLVPPVSSPDYVDAIIKTCKKYDIQAIFIGSDDELLALACAKERIEKETGAMLLANPQRVIEISRDKWKTYEFCKANSLPFASSALPDHSEEFASEYGFPLVVKPREGYGSVHFYIAKNKEEMNQAISAIEKAAWRPLVQQYLPGKDCEFTTGVAVDRGGKYVMSSISMRKSIKHGQTYKAFIDDYYDVRKSAERVALKLEATGSVNIQAKLQGDVPVVFEVNPRFSATTPLRAAAGVNEPDIVFRNAVLGEEIKVSGYQRLVCMRYWNEVYVPYSTFEKMQNSGELVEKENKTADVPFVLDYF